MAKPKVATVWLEGCAGGHMSFLDLDEALVDILAQIDLTVTPITDFKNYEFPDLDIIGCPRFASNPAAMYEYGNASKLEDFQYIYKYSPYQNVEQGVKYPAVLLITGDSDTRVPPLQARKMTARLQAATVSDENPIFLLYDTKAGHSGGKTLSEYINLFSYKMSFLFWQLDMSYKNFKEAEMYRK